MSHFVRASPSIVTTFPKPHIVSTVTSSWTRSIRPSRRPRARILPARLSELPSNVEKDASEKARTGASGDVTIRLSFREGEDRLLCSRVGRVLDAGASLCAFSAK